MAEPVGGAKAGHGVGHEAAAAHRPSVSKASSPSSSPWVGGTSVAVVIGAAQALEQMRG